MYTATGFNLGISTFFHLLPPTILVDLKFTDFIPTEQRIIDQIPGQLGEAYVQIFKHMSRNASLLKTFPECCYRKSYICIRA